LKLWNTNRLHGGSDVAPLTGARIETYLQLPLNEGDVSRPSRARGLKQTVPKLCTN